MHKFCVYVLIRTFCINFTNCRVNALIKWCAHSFKFALFCAYEQVRLQCDGYEVISMQSFTDYT